MDILASKKVIEGSEINVLHRESGVWILISKSEFDEDVDFDEDQLFLIDEKYLYSRIPLLKGKLDSKDGTTINVDYSTGEINVNPKHFHFGIPTHGAKATRQANAGFSFIHFLWTTKSNFTTPLIISYILFVIAKVWGWFFYIPLVLYLAYKILETFKTRDMYYSGALNPAIVIDAENSKIASLTDMSLGMGSYPLIRIRKYPCLKLIG